MLTLKPNSHHEKLLPQLEVPTDLPRHISHIPELEDWHRVTVVQAAEVWPDILSRESSRLTPWEGSLVLFDIYFQVKDAGLDILSSLSKSAPPVRDGSKPV